MQVERQVDQMVRFIKQEAEEKANEIMVSAEEVRRFFSVPNHLHWVIAQGCLQRMPRLILVSRLQNGNLTFIGLFGWGFSAMGVA